jgi:SAM-dependent methyltransferase
MDAGERDASRLAHEAIAAGDPTGWFEQLYSAAALGTATVPWDRHAPSPLLAHWAQERGLHAQVPQRALVVGCGTGDDAEFIAALGYATVAFDISPSAIRAARGRYPGSAVDYRTADLMAAPADWRQRYDLVIESMTLQALPGAVRAVAVTCLAPLVAPGGMLLVLARGRAAGEADQGPPWSLTRAEIDAVAGRELTVTGVREVIPPSGDGWRWQAEYRRPVPGRSPDHSS